MQCGVGSVGARQHARQHVLAPKHYHRERTLRMQHVAGVPPVRSSSSKQQAITESPFRIIFYLQMVWQILTSAASATTEHLISSSTKLCTVSCISPGSQTVMLAIMHCRWRWWRWQWGGRRKKAMLSAFFSRFFRFFFSFF